MQQSRTTVCSSCWRQCLRCIATQPNGHCALCCVNATADANAGGRLEQLAVTEKTWPNLQEETRSHPQVTADGVHDFSLALEVELHADLLGQLVHRRHQVEVQLLR